jgi:hypothetical protein
MALELLLRTERHGEANWPSSALFVANASKTDLNLKLINSGTGISYITDIIVVPT